MSFLPKLDSNFKEIHDLIYLSVQGYIVRTALEMKVFDKLCQEKKPAELGAEIDVPEERCRVFLDALVSCGYASKNEGVYSNTSLSKQYLVSNSNAYVGDTFMGTWKMTVDTMPSLSDNLKNGFDPTVAEEFGGGELWAELANANAQFSKAGFAQMVVEQISALPEFSSFEKMLDLGGGPGLIALSLAEANPGMQAVVLDQPEVVKVAQQYIDKLGFSDSVSVMSADYSKDDIGGDYDLIWASATLNFYRDDLSGILNKIHGSLNPGGYFACFQDGLTHQETQPLEMVISSFGALLQGAMKNFQQGEIAQAMLDAGFESVRSRTLETSAGPMDLDIARKAG